MTTNIDRAEIGHHGVGEANDKSESGVKQERVDTRVLG